MTTETQIYKCTKCGHRFGGDEIIEIEPEDADDYMGFVSPCCLAEYYEICG